jgi:hypothetical protein
MRFVERVEFNEAATVIFELTQDYDRQLAWNPFLKESRLVDGATDRFVLKPPFRLAAPLIKFILRWAAIKRLVALKQYLERGS